MAVVAGAALALLGATAGSASAATTDTVTCGTVSAQDPTDGWKVKLAGSACSHCYGDWFSVTDENSDGYHVEVHWQTDYAREGICKDSNGSGTEVTGDYDMAENCRWGNRSDPLWISAVRLDYRADRPPTDTGRRPNPMNRTG
ncbi:hypothetical protein [Micromonospora sp. CA-244673]|uniref:hypothetical protein n=1 Tax=Micromonospora sp. CA-244673 TaxID=3239958 RepID=UPI003D8A37D1